MYCIVWTRRLEEVGPENVVCVLSTTSCFAPRVPDRVDSIAEVCAKYGIGHIINNAYGLQCTRCCHLINEARPPPHSFSHSDRAHFSKRRFWDGKDARGNKNDASGEMILQSPTLTIHCGSATMYGRPTGLQGGSRRRSGSVHRQEPHGTSAPIATPHTHTHTHTHTHIAPQTLQPSARARAHPLPTRAR